MSNRWVRFLLAVAAIAAASAAAYRVVEDERRLAADVTATRTTEFTAETALTTLDDLKASLHAYVAPGQGLPFWAARAGMLLDKLRNTLLEIDKTLTAAGGTMRESLDSIDRLAAAEQRAHDHVRNGQALLAGDVIFNDARDLLDGLKIQIARARDHISAAASARHTELRREQITLIAGAIGVLTLVMLLLVPTGRRASPALSAAGAPSPTAPVAPATAELAIICGEIAAVGESAQLEPILQRVRDLLNARGVIVWVRSTDRMELHPAASSGYDVRVVARLGPIHRETGNLTASAFRDNVARTSAAAGTTAAALAVPLPSLDGPAGVFSAELTAGTNVDDGKLAAARVIAAQLGALVGSIPAAPAAAPDAPAVRSSS